MRGKPKDAKKVCFFVGILATKNLQLTFLYFTGKYFHLSYANIYDCEMAMLWNKISTSNSHRKFTDEHLFLLFSRRGKPIGKLLFLFAGRMECFTDGGYRP
jgi:hypothetical protein